MVGTGLILAIWAGWIDWRSRRVPNWLTVPSFFLGLGINTLVSGWPGAKMALEGAGLALAILLPLVLVRGLGAGDWKLMGALGAFLGPSKLIVVLLGTIFIAGVMAAAVMVWKKRVGRTLANVWTLLLIIATFGYRSGYEARGGITLDNPELTAVPFGTAAALSMALFVVLGLVRSSQLLVLGR